MRFQVFKKMTVNVGIAFHVKIGSEQLANDNKIEEATDRQLDYHCILCPVEIRCEDAGQVAKEQESRNCWPDLQTSDVRTVPRVNEKRRRFHGKESSPLEAVREQ